MTSKEKFLSMVSMSRKAGKLVMGFDSVKGQIMEGKAALCLVTMDASAKTRKEAAFVAEKYGTPCIDAPVTMEEIMKVAGKKSAVLGVLDKGLGDAVRRLALCD